MFQNSHTFGAASYPDLPTLGGQDYSKTYKPKKERDHVAELQRSPVLKALILMLCVAGLVYTFAHTGGGGGDETWVPRRAALEGEPPGEDLLDATLQQQRQQQPRRPGDTGSGGTRAATGARQQQLAGQRSGRKAAALERRDARQGGFNPLLHRLYEDLPALREPTRFLLAGGWTLNKPVFDYAANHPAAEVLSWDKPRLMLFRSFLTPEEVQHLIDVSTPNLVRSEVLTDTSGGAKASAVDKSRTSEGAWPPQDDVLRRIQDRIHRLVGVPETFGEGIYVLRYGQQQQYQGHNDHCMDGFQGKKVADPACLRFLQRAGGPDCGPGAGGPTCGDRLATFIMYLRTPTRGGATVFPVADLTKRRMAAAGKATRSDHSWYCQEEEVLGVRPGPGDAILFWNYVPGSGTGRGSYRNGTADSTAQTVHEAMHSGCPVLEGEKWVATRWIRSSGFDFERDS